MPKITDQMLTAAIARVVVGGVGVSLSPIPWLKILNSTYIFLFFHFPIDRFTFESRILNQNLQIKMNPSLAKPTIKVSKLRYAIF